MAADPSPHTPDAHHVEEFYQTRVDPVIRNMTTFDRWMVLIGMLCAAAAEIGTRYSVNVITIDMQGNVAASQDEISWVVTVYSAGFIAGLAMSAGVARFLGGRNFVVLTLMLFALGSLGCYVSRDLPHLLASRVAMGLGGGTMIVHAQVLLYEMFPGVSKAVPSVVFGVTLHTARAVYPLAMAYVTEQASWHDGFLICLPLLAVSAFLILGFLPRYVSQDRFTEADWIGVILMLGGLTAFQIAISRGERDEWLSSPLISGLLLIALTCLLLFLWWDSRPGHRNPLLHLQSLTSLPSLSASFVVAVCVGAVMASGLYVLPQYLRTLQTYSAFQTAGFYFVDGMGTVLAMIFGGKYVMPYTGPRGMLALGFAANAAIGWTFVAVLTPTTPTMVLVPLLFCHGIATGWLLSGMGNLALGSVPVAYVGESDTAYRVVRQFGAIGGVAGVSMLLDWRMTLHSSRLLDTANALNPITQSTLQKFAHIVAAGGVPGSPQLGALTMFQNDVITQSKLLAYVDIFWCYAWLCVISLGVLAVAAPAMRALRTYMHEDI